MSDSTLMRLSALVAEARGLLLELEGKSRQVAIANSDRYVDLRAVCGVIRPAVNAIDTALSALGYVERPASPPAGLASCDMTPGEISRLAEEMTKTFNHQVGVHLEHSARAHPDRPHWQHWSDAVKSGFIHIAQAMQQHIERARS